MVKKKKRKGQFTGAKTKAEFAAKDARLKRIKKGSTRKEEKKRSDNIDITNAKKRREEKESPTINLSKQKEESIQLNKPKGGQPVRDVVSKAVFGLESGVPKEERKILTGSLPIGIGGAAAALRGGEAAVNTLVRTVRSGKGGILGKFKTSIPGQQIPSTGQNAALQTTFQVNSKSQGLTNSFLGKVGLTIPSASILLGTIGSYPFAGFIKEEALQTLGFATRTALDNGDLEGAQKSIDETSEVLNPQAWEKIIGSIPYANVVKQLQDFYKAATTKVEADQTALDKLRQIQEGEIESDFERERRKSDEASFERKREFADEEAERYEGIRDDAEDRRKEEVQAANEEKRLNSIYFQLLRDKKFEEAEEFRITNFPTE